MFEWKRTLLHQGLSVSVAHVCLVAMTFAQGGELVAANRPGPVYARKASLQETMLSARTSYATAVSGQAEARGKVELGSWHLASVPIADQQLAQSRIDFAAKTADAKPCWVQKPEWKDAKPFDIPGTAAVLARTIVAENPVLLTVGVGGGDRLELFINGQQVLSADTAITYARYGTSMRLDGSRVDQIICRLPLQAGENHLVMKVRQESPGPRQASFSLTPNPVPYLWRQIERDFPRRANRLLDIVRFEWFETDGWFAQTDLRFERQLLARIQEELGQRGAPLSSRLQELDANEVPAGDQRWLDLCVTAAEYYAAIETIDKLRASVESLEETFADEYPGEQFLARVGELERRLTAKVADRVDPLEEASRLLSAELNSSRREMLVETNPFLKGRKLLFIRRYTYDSQHFYDDYYHGLHKYGGCICTLSIDDGRAQEVLPDLSGGVFDRFDLSFGAERVVFCYRPPKPEGFRIWEANVDGSGVKQLTFKPDDEDDRMARYSLHPISASAANPALHGHWTDDMHPCYLPTGEIVFASSRCERTAVCGGHTLPCTVLYKMNPDGTGMQRISQSMLSEFTPAVLEDGRVIYTRWEYVNKGIAAIQPLWVIRPDGSASEEIYGDNIRDPGVFYQARQVPGHANLIVSNGCGHEPLSVGEVLLLDLHKNKRSVEAMTSLTPDTEVRELRGFYQRRNDRWQKDDVYGPFYCDPFPLSDKYFLVSCNPDKRYNDESAYGIYLLDVFGNLVPIYNDPEMSCFVPTLLAPRPKPPVLPSHSMPGAIAEDEKQSPANQSAEAEATVLLTDVYNGLPGVERGDVKHLRVLRQIPRPWSVWPNAADDRFPGQMVAVSWHSHIWIAVLEGIVPVHEDGSAYFTVPADANIYFQALDEDFMEIQRMRTFVNFRPGEQRACIGCHEHRTQAPTGRLSDMPLALAHPPTKPGPQPGDIAPRPLHYEADVQPIFDKHCVSCHGNENPDGELALTADLTTHFNRSYEQIMSKELIKTIREWQSPPGQGGGWRWSMEHAPTIAPYSYGSHASSLIEILRKGHYDVRLSQPELVKLVTWVDTNGQYYGSYFGYRNVRYKDRKEFRPNPTLKSAYGTRPGMERLEPLEPVPGELLAHWTFDEGQGQTARDQSGSDYHGTVVGAKWTKGKLAGALQFSGNADYVRVGDIDGTFDALSIALWVRADSHKNRWNPLLFCDTWSEYDLHLSVLNTGHANVAIHQGSAGGYHRASEAMVGDGAWHHIALVCDQRVGGFLRFYVDGQPDRKYLLYGVDMPVRLTGVRLGGYNVWEKNPGANFHGSIDDFRIYRGMLTDRQVAELAKDPECCREGQSVE